MQPEPSPAAESFFKPADNLGPLSVAALLPVALDGDVCAECLGGGEVEVFCGFPELLSAGVDDQAMYRRTGLRSVRMSSQEQSYSVIPSNPERLAKPVSSHFFFLSGTHTRHGLLSGSVRLGTRARLGGAGQWSGAGVCCLDSAELPSFAVSQFLSVGSTCQCIPTKAKACQAPPWWKCGRLLLLNGCAAEHWPSLWCHDWAGVIVEGTL